MTTDNLGEFLDGRVLVTRQVHHVQFPVDLDAPIGVMLDSSEDGIAIVILPTIIRDLVHLETHFFVDGERVNPEITVPTETAGVVELTLRREKP